MRSRMAMWLCGWMMAIGAGAAWGAADPVSVSALTLEGVIDGENITFSLAFDVRVDQRNAAVPMVIGDAAYLDGKFPRGSELVREPDRYLLKFPSRGKGNVSFNFASRPAKDGDWRQTTFTIPAASVRKLSVICDRDDLEVQFPGALKTQREKTADNRTRVTAYLGVSNEFTVRWKPEVRKLTGELVVTCDANTIASASVGALKVDNLFTYRVVQGTLKQISLGLPANLNVTQVQGEDIQDWVIEKAANGTRTLQVTLSRPRDAEYRLRVESEMVLAKFPCDLGVPVITPQNVIRSSGFLMLGTDSAIKLVVNKAMGLTQVDQTAFPQVTLGTRKDAVRPLPTRSRFAYQYANLPYTLALAADDIVPEFSTDEQLILSVKDSDLSIQGSVEIDIRDAPAREMVIETDPKWVVANVEGQAISDYDVRDEAGKRVIHAYFRDAVIGRSLMVLRLEQTLGDKQTAAEMPLFKVRGAKSERGVVVVAAEKGIQVKTAKSTGLREVQTGSVEVRVADAQMAYRFKEAGWGLSLAIERTQPTISSDVFHLVSVGEGVLHCSAAVTYLIEGAPVRAFKMFIPAEFQNVEFTGRDVRNWEHTGETWTVYLQEKVIGDYTLLLTYDKQLKAGDLTVGGVRTVGTGTEIGCIVIASSASLKIDERKKDEALTVIDRAEVPEAYLLVVKDPVLKAMRYTRGPHEATLAVHRYDTEQLLSQVADHTTLSTEISKEGEAKTSVTYYIKNLTRQYLAVSLPKNARLWSTEIIDDQNQRRSVISLTQKEQTLIPVARPLNPNKPIRVEVTYAQTHGKLGALGSGVRLESPVLVDSQSTFANWLVHVPDKYAVGAVSGNMTPDDMPWVQGLVGVGRNVLGIYRLLVATCPGLTVFGLLLAVALCVLAYQRGRKAPLVWWTVGLVLGLIVAFVAAVVVDADRGCDGEMRCGFQALFIGTEDPTTFSVSKTLTLAGTDPLTLKLDVVPHWVGYRSSLVAAIAALLVGLWLVGRAVRRSGRFLLALGLTILMAGVVEIAATRPWVAGGIAIIVPLVLVIRLVRAWHARGRTNPYKPKMEKSMDIEPFEPAPAPATGAEAGTQGSVSIGLLALVAAATLAFPLWAGVAGEARAKAVVDPVPAMTVANLTVAAPTMADDAPKSADVTAVFEFRTDKPTSFMLLSTPAVLIEHKLNSRDLAIRTQSDGYRLEVSDEGAYRIEVKFSVPVTEVRGLKYLSLPVPKNMRNKVVFRVNEKELDIESPEAVMLKKSEKDNVSEATIVYGTAGQATISWKPRVRKTRLEKVVFFSEVNTLAVFEPGVVDLTHLIRYQIALGEMKSMTVAIPAGMTVTAATAPGLSTWRFDPATRLLEAVLEKPVSGDFTLQVVSQVSCEGLPYTASIGTIEVRDTARQRGSLALAVPDMVQVQVDKVDGLNPMNIEDVPADAVGAARRGLRATQPPVIKRAFRYDNLPVSAMIKAERVLPEIRVVENGSLSVSDEVIKLSTQLAISVSKAGVFSLRLVLPDGFDVESLTAQDMSHWDEVAADEKGAVKAAKGKGIREIVVHFKKQVTGDRTINLVVGRTEKGMDRTIKVPRVTVKDALKHAGTLVVSGERGVRMTTVEREGVSEINPRELGIRQTGVLAFKLLRPEWAVSLNTEIVAPTIRSEVVQRVDVSEGMLRGTAYIQYRIDHAGCKLFRLQAPAPGVALAVTGADVARVSEVDKAKGIWEVELHSKQENRYALTARYQINDTKAILPLVTMDTESQRGYLVLMSGGRVQVTPAGTPVGLKQDDSRTIPASFGAGDLSSAIYCFRTVGPDYRLDLAVVRHDAARQLPARVSSTRMTSVVSDGGQVLTCVQLEMTVGELRYLEMTLPGPDATLWSAFVKGKAATVSREGNTYRIPLEEPVAGEPTDVELVYAGSVSGRWFSRRQSFEGPKFNLPLNEIVWTFYVVPGQRYYAFEGTLEHEETDEFSAIFTAQAYEDNNARQMAEARDKAKTLMASVEGYEKTGNQQLAKKALESAVNYSQGDAAFNEDARIQYRNLAKQQAVVGFVQRRDEMRYNKNIQEVGQVERMEQFQGGNFTADYAAKVQESLSDRERVSLNRLFDRIMDQQDAAERVLQAIKVTMPEHGVRLQFYRKLQIEPKADMQVSFKAGSDWAWRWFVVLVAAAGFIVVFFLMFRPARTSGAA